MKIWQKVTSQFGKPSGFLGSIAGFIMAHHASNQERNTWAVDLLDLQLNDNVLEIGFGPGIALEMMSKFVASGTIYGIDHSQKMYSLAQKRNQNVITAGRMKLFLGSVLNLPKFNKRIDKVLDVNSFQFWNDPLNSLIAIKKCMNKGGIIAIVHQPRKPGSTALDAIEAGNKISSLLKEAGFERITVHTKNMKSAPTIYVIGNT
jgi:ubiquinone/menaquinone biosynthesis C-methylase UbiE